MVQPILLFLRQMGIFVEVNSTYSTSNKYLFAAHYFTCSPSQIV
uniref:Uncharacterized protein n=1 Tax=Arundo donax TaxID=35708 RepID=A0A0A8YCB9_ARUDO